MIIYFADRGMRILGNASTHLPDGLKIADDNKIEEVESGVASFECYLPYTKATRAKLEKCAEAGNYILRNHNGETDFYTILETEIDTKNQEIYVYAEDAGLDLLNDIVGAYEADQEYPISHYINKFAYDAGFKIKTNEVSGLTRKLKFDTEETATARLASVAAQFGCEISYSFKIKGLKIVNKYINLYESRGSDNGIQLRLNRDIDKIITTKSIANLATALRCEGGTPDEADEPITLNGYTYDDGDFFVSDGCLYSRKAVQTWGRYVWEDEPNQILGDCGHIVKQFSSDTTSQETLCKEAIAELKKLREIELNFEVDISKLPDNVKVGDRVYIIDEAGELYLSTRILKLENSVTKQKQAATLGEYLIKSDGIAKKVKDLAAQFAKQTVSVQRAKEIAKVAKTEAETAKTKAETAAQATQEAQTAANNAQTAANSALNAATKAEAEALAAKAAADKAENSVTSMENTVKNAQAAVTQAQEAATTAAQNAETAAQAAQKAQADAATAKQTAETAKTAAENAVDKADQAQSSAQLAKTEAEEATETAIAAKIDAEQAEKDIAELGDKLETVSRTMKTEYARKTDLTDTTADLQTQITQNAANIELSAHKLLFIDETANNAATKLEAAQAAATLAQEQADEATAEAEQAQAAANTALQAANDAQAEADTAKAAYETAKNVADEAEAALIAAKKDLETVKARADATEEEIAIAETALANAQQTADAAKTQADKAAVTAENALNVTVDAVANAEKAQIIADAAVNKAALAQANANEAKGDAAAAQAIAETATATALEAQEIADTARAAANEAQETANAAYISATEAQETANAANETLQEANSTLEAAESRLEEVLANVEATTEEVEAAQAAVTAAQNAADAARISAEAAQATADTAKVEADTAQAAADEAKAHADTAQAEADEAQKAADEAQGFVYALAKRSIEADTKIKQNADEIELRATKKEVIDTLGGFYTKEEANAEISTKADEITLVVNKEIQTLKDEDEATLEKVESNSSLIKQLSDSISMLVTDGNGASLMTQTDNGWTFSTTAIEAAVSGTSNSLKDLLESLGSTDAAVEILKQAVNDIETKTDYVNVSNYTYVNEQGVETTEPCIELGESENEYKLLITNTQILFKVGSNAPTKIRSDGLITENITVENEFRQTNDDINGFFIWAVRPNGNYGLQWKGDE